LIGNIKFAIIVLLGSYIFQEVINNKQYVALFTVFTGLIAYSYFRVRETTTARSPIVDVEKQHISQR
jgi:hypothetical protein